MVGELVGESNVRVAKQDIFVLVGLDPIEVFKDLPQNPLPAEDPIALYDQYLKTSGLKLITKGRRDKMKTSFTEGITGVHHDFAVLEATKEFNAAYDEERKLLNEQPFIYCFEAVCRRAGKEQIQGLFKDEVDNMVALLIDSITPWYLVCNAFADPVYEYLYRVLNDMAPEVVLAKTLGAHLDAIKKNATTPSGGGNRFVFDKNSTGIHSQKTRFSCNYLATYLMRSKNKAIAKQIKSELQKDGSHNPFMEKRPSVLPIWDVMNGTPLRQTIESLCQNSFVFSKYLAILRSILGLSPAQRGSWQRRHHRHTRCVEKFE